MGTEEVHIGFWWGDLWEEDHLKTQAWMDLYEVGWGGMDGIFLAEDRDRWRALVNAVTNLRVPQNAGKPGKLSAAQEWICCLK